MNASTINRIYPSEPDMIRTGPVDTSACVNTMEQMLPLFHYGETRMGQKTAASTG